MGGCSAECKPLNDAAEGLQIKKFVQGQDANTASGAVRVSRGAEYAYTLRVSNPDDKTYTGAKVTDNMPAQVEIIGTPAGTDWACTVNGQLITCLYNKTVAPKATLPDITVKAKIRDNVANGTKIKNVAAVCDPSKEVCEPTECKPGDLNYDPKTRKCDPSVVEVDEKDLEIKKYVKTINNVGDSQDAPVSVALGETFNYYYQFENLNSVAIKNVEIKDTFPEYLSHTGNVLVKDASGKDVTGDWTITRNKKVFADGKEHIYLIMKKKTDLPANSGKYTVTVPVTISTTAPANTSLQNMVYICGDEITGTPKDPKGNSVCDNPNPPEPPVPGQCTPENNPYQDPACIEVDGEFDLAIKKYVDPVSPSTDAQPGSPIAKNNNTDFNYVLRVQNVSSVSSSGTTTVKDQLPEKIASGATAPSGSGWTCSYAGRVLTCTTTQTVSANQYFTDITVPVRVSGSAGDEIRNDATVYNPNEKNGCYADNRMPAGSETSCAKDPKNTDPAVIRIPGGNTGSSAYKILYCATTNIVMETQSFDWTSCAAQRTEFGKRLNSSQYTECIPTTDLTDSVKESRKAALLPHCTTGGG